MLIKKLILSSILLFGFIIEASALTVTSENHRGAKSGLLFQGLPASFDIESKDVFIGCRGGDLTLHFVSDRGDPPNVNVTITSDWSGALVDPTRFPLKAGDTVDVHYASGRCSDLHVEIVVPQKPITPAPPIKINFKNWGAFKTYVYAEPPEKTGFVPIGNTQSFRPRTVFCVAIYAVTHYRNYLFIATKNDPATTTTIESTGDLAARGVDWAFKGSNGEDNPAGVVHVGKKPFYIVSRYACA